MPGRSTFLAIETRRRKAQAIARTRRLTAKVQAEISLFGSSISQIAVRKFPASLPQGIAIIAA
jgi:hypothetical protein